MNRLRSIVITALAVLAATATVALANQRGGESSPAPKGVAATTKAPAKATTAAKITLVSTSGKAKTAQSNRSATEPAEQGNEPAQTENEAAAESAPANDGPGGHEDPPGDVNHEFQGEE